jgi:hypothetical protein
MVVLAAVAVEMALLPLLEVVLEYLGKEILEEILHLQLQITTLEAVVVLEL